MALLHYPAKSKLVSLAKKKKKKRTPTGLQQRDRGGQFSLAYMCLALTLEKKGGGTKGEEVQKQKGEERGESKDFRDREERRQSVLLLLGSLAGNF